MRRPASPSGATGLHDPVSCPICHSLVAAYEGLADRLPGIAATNAMLVEQSGLSRRTLQNHRPSLVHADVLAAGAGLTGVPLAPPPAPSGPHPSSRAWLASLPVTCRRCHRILQELVELADGGWNVQIGIHDLADRLHLNESTVRNHLRGGPSTRSQHSLRAQGFVRFKAAGRTVIHAEQKKGQRGPDIYFLAAGGDHTAGAADRASIAGTPEQEQPADDQEFKWERSTDDEESRPARASDDELLERLVALLTNTTTWFRDDHPQARWFVHVVAHLVRHGWSEEILMKRLCLVPVTPTRARPES
ncbi:hypothetical protein DSC45_34540 [Streptomyces sp. YIM 130001]|uniref:hypothetical protein n=1 Tax=Streptomyces sp. YIM 130001 TaxID=2259644 RepID=UPI000EC533B7|nr:hypothetical protein [Streptomyces sp. YIM 130001]RII06948.1 hypothetical protein DSC45_34540 [Streptomyces sp. YIM 130001]